MILEYLFKGNKPNFDNIKLDNIIPKIIYQENSEIWIVKFELVGNSLPVAKTLSKLNEQIIKEMHPVVLADGSSAKFNEDLYPEFNEFERKLRMFLYLKSSMSKQSEEFDKLIKDLEKMELGKIFDSLFTDDSFIKTIKDKVNKKSNKFTKLEIINMIQEVEECSYWENIIGQDTVPTLFHEFNNLRLYRNDIMHAHNFNYKKYMDAKNLIKKVNLELTETIEKMVTCEDTLFESDDNFNESLNSLINKLESQDDFDYFKSIGKKWLYEYLKDK